jgi:proton glutamate symport protein
MKKGKIKLALASQIVIGLILGVIVGTVFYGKPGVIAYIKPFGDIFIRLIKMIVIPIVFSSIVVGVAGNGNMKEVGKVGAKTILYFELVSTIAIVVGLVAANVFHPGTGINMSGMMKSNISTYVDTAKAVGTNSFTNTLVNIVPTNIVQALASGDMLAVIFFAVMFGIGASVIGEKGKPVINFFQGVAQTMFWVTNQIMKLAPIGVFSLIGVTVSTFGLKALIPLGKLALLTYGSMIFFILVVLGLIAKFAGSSIFTIIKVLKAELILAYSTASSEAVLPKLMEKMEKFGCPKSITTFVIPIGYTFNLDGSTLYEAIAAIFIAQMYGIPMSIAAQIKLVIVLMLTSKGIAGVPGASFVVLCATLGTVGLPIEGLAFIAGIDRILDMARSAVNVCGNSLATIIVSKWENRYDKAKAATYFITENDSETADDVA